MNTRLYLDTARLGRLCPEAQAADQDFARFASEEGCCVYFEQFLQSGYTALPHRLAKEYPGLSFWAGVRAFKDDLKAALCLPRERPVFIANRSAQLVRMAARLLVSQCDNILVTDMEWPAYLQTLETEVDRAGRSLTKIPLREAVLGEEATEAELVDSIATAYRSGNCDGIFLSAVTFQGVRVPVAKILQAIGPRYRPRFTVVDGAQAVNHVPLGLDAGYCDLLLTGCHKWLRAYHPLGLGVCCRAQSEQVVRRTYAGMRHQGELDDPLLAFSSQLETGQRESFSETVSLVPMFTAAAAVRRMLASSRAKREELASQVDNADRLAEQAPAAGWRPKRPDAGLRSGILLLEPQSATARSAPPDVLRERLLVAGVALTAYEGGVIRASLPDVPLSPSQYDAFQAALSRCA
jgi:hypothetical protein